MFDAHAALSVQWCLMAALTGAAVFFAMPAAAQQFYRIESAVAMKSAAPNWDYVTFEPARSYLYIARRQDGVTVYDVKARKVIGNIEKSEQANAPPWSPNSTADTPPTKTDRPPLFGFRR